jgi:hypothetical protein
MYTKPEQKTFKPSSLCSFSMHFYEFLPELPNLVAQASSNNPHLSRSMPGADEMD